MNRAQLRQSIKNFINEPDPDEQIDAIINDAIEYAYSDLSNIDKRIETTYAPSVNGSIQLPDNLLRIVSIEPKLSKNSKRIGNVILTDQEGIFTIKYEAERDMIVDDNVELDLHKRLEKAIVLYAAAQYFDYRKKTEQAQWLYAKYENVKGEFSYISDIDAEEGVSDVYRGVSEDE